MLLTDSYLGHMLNDYKKNCQNLAKKKIKKMNHNTKNLLQSDSHSALWAMSCKVSFTEHITPLTEKKLTHSYAEPAF